MTLSLTFASYIGHDSQTNSIFVDLSSTFNSIFSGKGVVLEEGDIIFISVTLKSLPLIVSSQPT